MNESYADTLKFNICGVGIQFFCEQSDLNASLQSYLRQFRGGSTAVVVRVYILSSAPKGAKQNVQIASPELNMALECEVGLDAWRIIALLLEQVIVRSRKGCIVLRGIVISRGYQRNALLLGPASRCNSVAQGLLDLGFNCISNNVVILHARSVAEALPLGLFLTSPITESYGHSRTVRNSLISDEEHYWLRDYKLSCKQDQITAPLGRHGISHCFVLLPGRRGGSEVRWCLPEKTSLWIQSSYFCGAGRLRMPYGKELPRLMRLFAFTRHLSQNVKCMEVLSNDDDNSINHILNQI